MVKMNEFSTAGQLLPRNGIHCRNPVDEFQLQRGENLCGHGALDAGSKASPARFIFTEHGWLTITVLSSGEATRALVARCPPAPSEHGLRSYHGNNVLADDRYGPCFPFHWMGENVWLNWTSFVIWKQRFLRTFL